MSIDPTRIDIQTDPTSRRMRGVATHGRTPFDVPFISEIEGENLWIGGCKDGLRLPSHIEHIVSLYPWERYTIRHEMKSQMIVRLYDALGDVDQEKIEAIAKWVNICRQDAPTLVHCQAGLNRSNLVAATALILDGLTPTDAIYKLREARSPAVLCNRSFIEHLYHTYAPGENAWEEDKQNFKNLLSKQLTDLRAFGDELREGMDDPVPDF